MDDVKDGSNSLSELSISSEDYESDLYLKGPPFNPKDYMISPSNSDSSTVKEYLVSVKKKTLPIDLKFEQDALEARKSLKKLQNLTRDKFGKNLVKRQGNLVRAIVRGMPSGFLMEDIAPVTEVIEYFIVNCKSVPEYANMIQMLLTIAVNPPRIMRSSETVNCKKELGSYFTMLGELLATFDETAVQFRVLEILNSLLVRSKPVDLACVKLPFCYAAMEGSLLPYTVACLLETIPDELYILYLNLSLQMALVSKKACITMARNGAMEFILSRLHTHHGLDERSVASAGNACAEDIKSEKKRDEYYAILDAVGHLMWIFLNNVNDLGVCGNPSQKALWSLRIVFHWEAAKRTEKAVNTRNNLAGIILKLYTVFGEVLPLLQSGLAVDVAMLAVATEIGTEGTWAENISFGTSKEDYLLKEMMMVGCCALAKDENMSEILRERKVMEGILRLINPDVNTLSVPWSSSQFLVLLITGLAVLAELAPVLPDVYVVNEGNVRLLLTLEWFMEEHFDKLPLLETLKTLCALISCKNCSEIIKDLKKRHAVKILMDLCFYLLDSESLKTDHQEKLTRVFFLLEKLCENERKIDSSAYRYVDASIKFLTRATKNKQEDTKFEPKLLICFSAFLWEAVVWCRILLNCFTEQNGIYLLLDLVEISSYPVQIMLLGLLVDLADEGETITHLLTWRDKNGYGILNAMIKIWKKEELFHNVPRTGNGCISDIERVLMSEEQWYLTHCVQNKNIFSPSIAEMMCSARPKIHSLYRFFRERYGEFTQMNESLYSVSFAAVEPQNQVFIPLIENFFTLKLGEIWYEIYREVIAGGIVPTGIDGETLRKLVERKNEWAYRLNTLQKEIVELQKVNSSDAERKLYQLMRSCCMTSALDALHDLDFIARTTYKDIQVKRKRFQLTEIKRSLNMPLGVEDSHIHRTAVRDGNVTYLYGKYVWFKSEREVVPESFFIQPVSPNSSSCNTTNL